ncbi:hypothetical protein [Candidatus Berkiella aquae]|uniref:Uncharacterized protein n=1 Tax=Candidatus Berkiella aquae TaxID=295108 RepID=A0A0Q9YD66_9GAMM|nr:hypothetical protein [Candidatus Berkiella aquae]MCS5709914.1 hypothetical protein [Candidatus Berkiella aquae]
MLSQLEFTAWLGKLRIDVLPLIEGAFDFSSTLSGESVTLHLPIPVSALTFDVDDKLVKIEMRLPGSWAQSWLTQYHLDGNPPLKGQVLSKIGVPTVSIPYPISMGVQEQWLYNHGNYWFSLKFEDEKLTCISLLLPHLINDTIKGRSMPIRTCKG